MRTQKLVAIGITGATFAASLRLLRDFQPIPGMQFEVTRRWLSEYGTSYHVGVDGISLWLVLLTTFLTPIALIGSWAGIQQRVKAFNIFMLLLEAGMIGVFIALDLFLFFIFWEAMLIPMYFLIGIWGHERRIYAAVKFFLYTMAGSALMLVAFFALYKASGMATFDVLVLAKHPVDPHLQMWLFAAFALAFAIKVPMWPFHTWLPDAHVEAPTAGSVILAGVMLKMGGYGFLRLAIPLFPQAAARVRALDRRPGRHRDRVRRPGLAGAARPQEAGRVLLGVPPRVRDAGHRVLHDHGGGGRDLPDAEPRHLHRRPLPDGGDALRPPPHPPDRGLRRAQERDALVLVGVPADLALLHRGARLQRLRGGVPDPRRLLAA